jgi:hypothetical protein
MTRSNTFMNKNSLNIFKSNVSELSNDTGNGGGDKLNILV